jgi:zinc transport system substrate-binding protein
MLSYYSPNHFANHLHLKVDRYFVNILSVISPEEIMKRQFGAFAVISIIIVSGCSTKTSPPAKSFNAIASFYPIYIIAKNIADGIPGVTVTNLTPPYTGCLHDYSISADDMKHLEKADLFITNGAGMESFLDKTAAKYPKLVTVKLADGIDLIKEGKESNPHVWLSITNTIQMTKNCMKAFEDADIIHADLYKKNGNRYIEQLSALKKEMDDSMKPFTGRKIITFHESFPYFAKEYKLVIAAVIEREPGSEPSAKELAETVTIVRSSKIKTLFTEPQYPSSAAKIIAKETGASIFILDPAVTGDDDPNAYIKIMTQNKETLINALK